MRPQTLAGLVLRLATLVTGRMLGHQYPITNDSELVSKAFPRQDEVKLLSPMFLNSSIIQQGFYNGTSSPMSHEDMDSFLKRVVRSSFYMTYNTTNFKSEEGRSIPFVRIASDKNVARLRILLQGGVYGDEPASDEILYALLATLVTNPERLDRLMQVMEIMVLPRYNPDGVSHFRPRLGNGTKNAIDPDRDHILLQSNHTKNMKKMFNKYDPHVLIDMREYNGTGDFSAGQYQQGADILYAMGNNLNIARPIRELSKNIADDIEKAMFLNNFRTGSYYEDGITARDENYVANLTGAVTDAGTGRNAVGLTQTVSLMVATRGLYLGQQHFQRRVAAGHAFLEAFLDIAGRRYDKIINQVENGRDHFQLSQPDAVLTDNAKLTRENYPWVQTMDGEVVYKPAGLDSTTPPFANLTRTRPEAYLIPANVSTGVVNRLETLGLKMEKYDEHRDECVQVLEFLSYPRHEGLAGEGHFVDNMVTMSHAADLNITAGTFSVSTRQKNGALAIVTLEPENVDSFASWNIIRPWKDMRYPVVGKMPSEYCAQL